MQLVRLNDNAVNNFGFRCEGCGHFMSSAQGGWADLDGKAFHTFYCKECGDACSRNMQGVPESPPTEKDS